MLDSVNFSPSWSSAGLGRQIADYSSFGSKAADVISFKDQNFSKMSKV